MTRFLLPATALMFGPKFGWTFWPFLPWKPIFSFAVPSNWPELFARTFARTLPFPCFFVPDHYLSSVKNNWSIGALNKSSGDKFSERMSFYTIFHVFTSLAIQQHMEWNIHRSQQTSFCWPHSNSGLARRPRFAPSRTSFANLIFVPTKFRARQRSGEGVVRRMVVQKGVFGESVSSLPP